jgi:glutaryl-CoA dehydrogenase (non-decarboxylating)
MIDFSITEEQESVAQMVREFAEREVYPTIKEHDRKQSMHPAVLPRMAELGILGVNIPVRYGGQGFDYVTLGLVCEELERVDTTLRVVMSVHMGLNSMGKGEKYGAFCLTEPGAGSDVAALASTARRDGDDYIINGEKMWISLATKAHNFLWFAKTDPKAEPAHKGITAFMVESDMLGVTSGDIHDKLGVRAGSTGWVNCEDVRVPAGNRIGAEGEGFKIAMSCLDNGRYTVAAGATGLIRASMEASIKYAKERHTFGRPIAKHQLIRQKIAWMQQWYDAARLLYLRVGWLKNEGTRNTREVSMAKWYATDMSFKAAHEAIQVHGAYGFSDEYDVERYLRNSRGAIIYEGTSEIHQLMQSDYALGNRVDRPLRCELPAFDADFWQSE